MKGMTLDQFKQLVDFVYKHHRFGWVSDRDRIVEVEYEGKKILTWFHIKYIDSCYDSRTNDVWTVTFRQMADKITFQTNMVDINVPHENLYDWCMAYLKGEYKPYAEQIK